MCGILGYIARENIRDTQEKFINSLGMLSHRGPDFLFVSFINPLYDFCRDFHYIKLLSDKQVRKFIDNT